MRSIRWAVASRLAALSVCAAGLSGCAWLLGEPQAVNGGLEQRQSVTYGDGSVTIELTPQAELPPASGGKNVPRVLLKPSLTLKPGDERLAMQPPTAAPAAAAYTPGWSIENSGRAAGLMFNGKRLDPTGMINPNLLRQALARVAREANGDALARIAVVDFSLPADKPRWFFVDMKTGGVVAKYVSHGHAKRLCRAGGCGPHHQAGFSLNTPAVSAAANTDATSVGLYKVLGLRPEGGKFPGPTIALAGLDPTNESALRRGIIIHQNPRYFDPKRRLFGRSQGCFVFGPDDLQTVVDTLTPGSLIYAGMPARTTAAAKPVKPTLPRGVN
jgi:hypothetical protein